MTDTALVNGKQSSTSELTELEYKELCKKVRQHQMKKGEKKKTPRVLNSINANSIKREIMIADTQTPFEYLAIGTCFSRDDKGHVLYIKNGINRVRCLNTGRPEKVDGGEVYQVFL